MSAELLNCPFCGGEANADEYDNESLYSHAIVKYKRIACGQCDTAIIDGENHDEVIAAWNRRAPAQAQGATLTDAQIKLMATEYVKWNARAAAGLNESFDTVAFARALLAQAQPANHVEDARQMAGADDARNTELIELLESVKPKYGAVGSRDVDVTASRARIDAAIAALKKEVK